MAVDVLLGLQWGDEGKGKIVDYIAPKYDIVARFQGGPNAGHTLVFDGKKHVLHQIPSGIFHPHIVNVIGNGVVLDAIIFQKEIEALEVRNVNPRLNLFISKKTQLIIPTHRLLDAASEAQKGDGKIGSTLKGIGPTYQDKYARNGLRVGDILLPDFKTRYEEVKKYHTQLLAFYNYNDENLAANEEKFFDAIEFLKEFHLTETEYLINNAIADGKAILAEGAQGSLLDVDFGSYPFVTSSTTMAAGACTGLGIAPKEITEVYGIFKAYCTRVGSGPFPTELLDNVGDEMRKEGHEFGSTTGRPRRCGWLDLPTLKYACMINGTTQLLMMKADVLNIFDEIKVCTHYQFEDGTITDKIPHDMQRTVIQPVYETLKGWGHTLTGHEKFETLPAALLNYISFIEEALGLPIMLVSMGPDRSQTVSKLNF